MVNRRKFVQALCAGCLLTRRGNSHTQDMQSSGSSNPSLSSVDIAIKRFLETHKIPGASIAISKGRKLLYAKGFGVQQLGTKQVVEPTSLFRVASISKSITGVAVSTLLEKNELTLSDKVHELLELREPKDGRWKAITVEQLLRHTAGFDREKSFDPMFHAREIASARKLSFPITHADIIDYMLDQPLDLDPGKKYAYSNFGYCLLGRVIEKVSGKSYEAYVNQTIWQPLSVKDVHIAQSRASLRRENEVSYHDVSNRQATPVVATDEKSVLYPYGAWDVAAMDSHGGWLCSAPQLVRLAGDVDPSIKSKILSAKAISAMFSRSGQDGDDPVGYGLGWQVRSLGDNRINVWHFGRIAGTATMLVKRHDGFNWAALFNADLTSGGKYISEVFDPEMHKIVDQVKRWPSNDLFKEYLT